MLIQSILWASDFRVNSRIAESFQRGNIFLAGDAAHIHSPTGGQGITTGIQDAYNLGWKLTQVLRYNAPGSLLETYNDERIPIAKKVLRGTEKNTSIFIGKNQWQRLLRDWLILPILRTKSVQRSLLINLTQLKFHYRKSKLSVMKGSSSRRCKIKPGERAPDVSFKRKHNSTPVTLFDLLKKGKPLVVFCIFDQSFKPEQAIAMEEKIKRYAVDTFFIASEQFDIGGATNVLIDSHSDFRQKYCINKLFTLLIRPDGYIGFFEAGINSDNLIDYCNSFLGRNREFSGSTFI